MEKFSSIAIVEFRNSSPYVYRIQSDEPITINKVARYFQENEDWDEARDNITLIDDLYEINI